MTGLWVLVLVAVAAVAIGLLLRLVNGRFRRRPSGESLGPRDLGAELGDRATLVQFSSAFCSPCRATRSLLQDVVAGADDVTYVDVDAESHLDLVRRLNIVRTPTVLILDSSGTIVRRATGLPRREQVVAALAAV